MKRVLLASAVLAILAGLMMAGQRRLTLSEAERLVRAAISDEAKRLPGLHLEPPPTTAKHGATFNVLWSGSASGNVPVQSLVVDIDTAEVWDAAKCQLLSTPALKAIQSVIRRELKIAPTAVSRARAEAEMSGCSILIDPRPKRSDFHPAQLISVDTDQSGASRYAVTSGGCAYIIFSPVPLNTEGGEVKIAILAGSMYVIDDVGRIREVRFERGVCA